MNQVTLRQRIQELQNLCEQQKINWGERIKRLPQDDDRLIVAGLATLLNLSLPGALNPSTPPLRRLAAATEQPPNLEVCLSEFADCLWKASALITGTGGNVEFQFSVSAVSLSPLGFTLWPSSEAPTSVAGVGTGETRNNLR